MIFQLALYQVKVYPSFSLMPHAVVTGNVRHYRKSLWWLCGQEGALLANSPLEREGSDQWAKGCLKVSTLKHTVTDSFLNPNH